METDNEYLMRSNDLLIQYNNMCREKDTKILALKTRLALLKKLPKLKIEPKQHHEPRSFYAVFNGVDKTKNIYSSWNEAKVHIIRVKKVRHKRFNTNLDARNWLRNF